MSDGTCRCGLAFEDPIHDRWHPLLEWNQAVFERAAREREAAFDTELADHRRRHGRVPADPQGRLATDTRPVGNTYSR